MHCHLYGTFLETFTSIHLTAWLPLQLGNIVLWPLNHSATLWGIYLVTLSDLSLTPYLSLMLRDPWNRPRRCWCFEPRCCCFPPFHLFSPPLSCLQEERWDPRGWRPPTGYQLCHSVTQSEWLTAEQVASLGGPSLSVIFPSSICHVVTQATMCILGGK